MDVLDSQLLIIHELKLPLPLYQTKSCRSSHQIISKNLMNVEFFFTSKCVRYAFKDFISYVGFEVFTV